MTSEKKPRPRTDWEPIERDYRAGVLSIREIAKSHGVSDTAVRKKAFADGWSRDLSARVSSQAMADLVRGELRTANPKTEQEIVDAAAATVVSVVREHRTNIQRFNRIALALLDELDDQTISRDLYMELGDLLRAEDDKGADKRNDLYQKIISGAGRIDGMKKLAETLRILITLERQAFNIAGEGERSTDPVSDLVEFLQSRAKRLPIAHEDE